MNMSEDAPKEELKDELIIPSKIAVKPSKLHGYGIFATEDIQKDEVLEEISYVKFSHRAADLVKHTDNILMVDIMNSCYIIPCDCDDCKTYGPHFIMSSGYLQLYNSSETEEDQDIFLKWSTNSRTAAIVAKRNIKKDQEILNFYKQPDNPTDDVKELEDILLPS